MILKSKLPASFAAVIFIAFLSGTGWLKPTISSSSHLSQLPEIKVRHTSSSPLDIILSDTKEVTPENPKIEFIVVNMSSQPIIAYAIRYETISNRSKGGGNIIVNAPSISQSLQPGQVHTEVIGDDVVHRDPVLKILLYVDYVELADGSNWGPDDSGAAETLAGERAGARLYIDKAKGLSKAHGVITMMNKIDQMDFSSDIPPDATPYWVKGFRAGVGTEKYRLRQAYEKNGVSALEDEMNKPFDASFDRR